MVRRACLSLTLPLLVLAGCGGGTTTITIEPEAGVPADLAGLGRLPGGDEDLAMGCGSDCTWCCDGKCVDATSDPKNCGGCGAACAPGLACCGGVCTDTTSSVGNCGACGAPCSFANARASCEAGACGLGSCEHGFGDCDHQPATGCEKDLRTDVNSCGACGHACSYRNGVAGCAGECYLAACSYGFDDCNNVPDDGCETSTLADARNCGACGNSCGGLPHAKVGCTVGVCAIASCDAGFLDCNRKDVDGCEVNTLGDSANCGGCGAACPQGLVCRSGACTCPQCNFPNAKSVCKNNQCALDSCLPGFLDCDGKPGNGCEVDSTSDIANCGGCGMACAQGNICHGGNCSLILVSDTSWKQIRNAPAGWEQPGFDDSKWVAAVDEGLYGTAPWNHMKTFDNLQTSAHWIWYYDSRNAGDTDTVYFRRAFTATAKSVTLVITADDNYVVWLDGQQVAQSFDVWSVVHTWDLQLTLNHDYVLAIKAINTGGPGGLLLDMR